MSIIKGAKYVCDHCGKEVFVAQIQERIKEEPNSVFVKYPRPAGWKWRNNSEELLCDECVGNIPENN